MSKNMAVLITAVPVYLFGILNGIYLNHLPPNLILLIDLIFMVIVPCSSFFILSRKFGFSLRDLGIAFDNNFRNLIENSILCIIVWLVADWLLTSLSWALLWRFDWALNTQVFSYLQILPTQPLLRALVYIYLVVSAAVIEEIYYRGLLRYFWVVRYGKSQGQWSYTIISAALFGLAHWEGGLAKIVTLFFLGMIAARLLIWTKSLIPLIAAHFVTDLVFL